MSHSGLLQCGENGWIEPPWGYHPVNHRPIETVKYLSQFRVHKVKLFLEILILKGKIEHLLLIIDPLALFNDFHGLNLYSRLVACISVKPTNTNLLFQILDHR
jgi:hypothetical protein